MCVCVCVYIYIYIYIYKTQSINFAGNLFADFSERKA